MPAHVEQRLIAKIVQTKNLRAVLKGNISQRMLRTPEAREMYKAIKSYYLDSAHYGKIPGSRWMKERFPTFQQMKPSETLEELCEEIRRIAMSQEIMEACEEIAEVADSDPYRALELMRSKALLAQSMTTNSRDLLFAEGGEELIEIYKQRKNSTHLLGVPWPWDELNEETQGIQEEDFIIFFARPKTLKSWMALKCAIHAYAYGARRVMYYSCEMPSEQCRERAACIYAGLDYDRLRKGKLTPLEERLYYVNLRSIKDDEKRSATDSHTPALLFTHFMDAPGGGGISHLMGKADSFQPDLIIADSYYRMKNDRSGRISRKPGEQAEITMDLKNATQQMKVPIIGVTQRNRYGEKESTEEDETASDVAFTDAGGQEADMFIRWSKGKTPQPDGSIFLTGMIAGAREIRAGGMLFKVNPATQWEFVSWITDQGKHVGSDINPPQPVESKSNGSMNKTPTPDEAFLDFEN